MIVKVSRPTEQHEYVWQLASGQWFATAAQQCFASRGEAVNATRVELDRVRRLVCG